MYSTHDCFHLHPWHLGQLHSPVGCWGWQGNPPPLPCGERYAGDCQHQLLLHLPTAMWVWGGGRGWGGGEHVQYNYVYSLEVISHPVHARCITYVFPTINLIPLIIQHPYKKRFLVFSKGCPTCTCACCVHVCIMLQTGIKCTHLHVHVWMHVHIHFVHVHVPGLLSTLYIHALAGFAQQGSLVLKARQSLLGFLSMMYM